MKKLESLFPGMNTAQINQELANLHTSGEYYYLNRQRKAVTDINDNVNIIKGEYYDTCRGFYRVTVNGQQVRIHVDVLLENWDDDEKCYQVESLDPIGWDYEESAKKRYAEKVEVVRSVWLHRYNDADIIEWLDKQPSKSDYIKQLIRADKEKSGR